MIHMQQSVTEQVASSIKQSSMSTTVNLSHDRLLRSKVHRSGPSESSGSDTAEETVNTESFMFSEATENRHLVVGSKFYVLLLSIVFFDLVYCSFLW